MPKLSRVEHLAGVLAQLKPASPRLVIFCLSSGICSVTELEEAKLSLTVARIAIMYLLNKDFHVDMVFIFLVAVAAIVFFVFVEATPAGIFLRRISGLSGRRGGERDSNSGIPHWLVLVFLGCIWRAVLLALA